MQVHRSSDPKRLPPGGRVFALGTFDGVHRGHAALVRRACALAGELRGAGPAPSPWALTFDPHPARLLAPARAPALLCSLEERLRWLEAAGAKGVWVLPFEQALAALEPQAFVDELLLAGGARGLVVGHDFTFGRDRAGDAHTLKTLARQAGIPVKIVSPVRTASGQIISSTAIRRRVSAGDLGGAAEMLGRAVSFSGIVQPGAGRGSTIGFPTANLGSVELLLPGTGVYAGVGRLDDEAVHRVAAINVGVAPTFGELLRPQVEAHLLGQPSASLAGRCLHLTFLRRLRGERRFAGVEALRAQLARDVRDARFIAETLHPSRVPDGSS